MSDLVNFELHGSADVGRCDFVKMEAIVATARNRSAKQVCILRVRLEQVDFLCARCVALDVPAVETYVSAYIPQ